MREFAVRPASPAAVPAPVPV